MSPLRERAVPVTAFRGPKYVSGLSRRDQVLIVHDARGRLWSVRVRQDVLEFCSSPFGVCSSDSAPNEHDCDVEASIYENNC